VYRGDSTFTYAGGENTDGAKMYSPGISGWGETSTREQVPATKRTRI